MLFVVRSINFFRHNYLDNKVNIIIFVLCLDVGCSDGEIGRHAGLKIL